MITALFIFFILATLSLVNATRYFQHNKEILSHTSKDEALFFTKSAFSFFLVYKSAYKFIISKNKETKAKDISEQTKLVLETNIKAFWYNYLIASFFLVIIILFSLLFSDAKNTLNNPYLRFITPRL